MKGFTLVELLVVIAIIGVLATTVVISLGNQTGKARDSSVKKGVSTLRTPLIVAADIDSKSGVNICNEAYDQVSGDKDGWYWSRGTMCNRDTLVAANSLTATGSSATTGGVDGDLCCYANGSKWVVWGGLSDADGFGANVPSQNSAVLTNPKMDVFCADSSGFLGEVDLGNTNDNVAIPGKANCQ